MFYSEHFVIVIYWMEQTAYRGMNSPVCLHHWTWNLYVIPGREASSFRPPSFTIRFVSVPSVIVCVCVCVPGWAHIRMPFYACAKRSAATAPSTFFHPPTLRLHGSSVRFVFVMPAVRPHGRFDQVYSVLCVFTMCVSTVCAQKHVRR